MQTNTYNFARVGQLMRYDWVLTKSSLSKMFFIHIGLFIVLGLFYLMSAKTMSADSQFILEPYFIAYSISSFYNYVALGAGLLIAFLLLPKFNNPRIATGYLSMPGSSAEKFTALVGNMLAIYVTVCLSFLAMFGLSMLVCSWLAPTQDWALNPLNYWDGTGLLRQMQIEGKLFEVESPSYQASHLPELIFDTISLVCQLAWAMNLVSWLFFYNLCLYFRRNPILKSIGVSVLIGILLVLASIIFVISFIRFGETHTDTEIFSLIEIVIYTIRGVFWAMPAIALAMLAILYRQICRKQAK